jgi:hypothetical protein
LLAYLHFSEVLAKAQPAMSSRTCQTNKEQNMLQLLSLTCLPMYTFLTFWKNPSMAMSSRICHTNMKQNNMLQHVIPHLLAYVHFSEVLEEP